MCIWGFPCGSAKESVCSAGDLGSVLGLERSPGEGNGYPLQYSCLENPMDRGAWWVTVHGVTKSQTRPKNYLTHTFVHKYMDIFILYYTYLGIYAYRHINTLTYAYIS